MPVFFALFFAFGIFQLFAIIDGIQLLTGFPFWLSLILSFVATYTPFIGSVLGVYGAHYVWDWNIWLCLLIFFWHVPVIIISLISGDR